MVLSFCFIYKSKQKINKMIKKALKIFLIPAILAVITILFHIHIDQTLFTWIVAKILVIVTLVSHFGAFILFIDNGDEVFTKGALLKIKDKILPFTGSVLLVLAIYLGYLTVFSVPTYFLYSYYEVPTLNILLGLFAFILSIKFLFAPIEVIKNNEKPFQSVWGSRSRKDLKTSFLIFIVFLVISIIGSLAFYSFSRLVPEIDLISWIIVGYLINYTALILFASYLLRRFARNEEKESSVRKLKRVITGIFAVLGIPYLVLILIFNLSILFRDYDPQFEIPESLIVEKEEVRDEDNLYLFLKNQGFMRSDMDEIPDGCGQINFQDPSMIEEMEEHSGKNSHKFITDNPEKAE